MIREDVFERLRAQDAHFEEIEKVPLESITGEPVQVIKRFRTNGVVAIEEKGAEREYVAPVKLSLKVASAGMRLSCVPGT